MSCELRVCGTRSFSDRTRAHLGQEQSARFAVGDLVEKVRPIPIRNYLVPFVALAEHPRIKDGAPDLETVERNERASHGRLLRDPRVELRPRRSLNDRVAVRPLPEDSRI